jgi:hypothetical protein
MRNAGAPKRDRQEIHRKTVRVKVACEKDRVISNSIYSPGSKGILERP